MAGRKRESGQDRDGTAKRRTGEGRCGGADARLRIGGPDGGTGGDGSRDGMGEGWGPPGTDGDRPENGREIDGDLRESMRIDGKRMGIEGGERLDGPGRVIRTSNPKEEKEIFGG